MLRVVLVLLYLAASSFTALQTDPGGGLDPLGLGSQSPTADYGGGYDPDGAPKADYGAGYDPNGASSPSPAAPTSDAGAGNDPNG
jgi:hypothetical protein